MESVNKERQFNRNSNCVNGTVNFQMKLGLCEEIKKIYEPAKYFRLQIYKYVKNKMYKNYGN